METTMQVRWRTAVVIMLASVALAGCGDAKQKASPAPAKLTASQRDSVTAASRLPGAGAMKQALVDADSAAARAARVNAAAK
jgi:hypothetical protein